MKSAEALALVDEPAADLCEQARAVRERGKGVLVTYSPKIFIPLTKLCRDVCHYCTFARPPRRGERAFMSLEEVVELARAGVEAGCHEALFTLGDKPELRYRVARRKVSVSQGIMLETASVRLSERGRPHYGSPDKLPARRLETMRLAGELAIPFTTGILIGIGETRAERIEALLAIREVGERYGNVQEVIV